jgi:titin
MLAWTVPSDTGGSPITGYEWTTTTSIGWQSFVGLALSGEVQIVIPPPITTSFTFKVRAKNIKGPGSVSNTRTIPGAPVLNSATSGDTQVTLAWATPSDTGSLSITDYEWRKNSGLWDPLGSTALTRVVSGLINGDPYTFEVRAQNSDGDGFTSNSLTATPSTTPGAPVLNSATHGDIKVTLVWAEPLDTGGSPITDYEWTDNSGASWDAFGSTALTGEITPLTNGTPYTFKVRAVNANGVGLLSSNSLTATPSTTPSAPVLNSATPSNTQVTLVWAEPLDTGGLTINDYEWTDNSGATWTSFGNTALTGIITGLAKGTSYTFEVRANNVNGGGTNSNSLTATIPSTIPGAPVFNSATPGDRRITLTWAEPLDTGGSPIIEYHVILVGATGWSSVGSGLTIAWVDLSNGTPYTFKVRAVNANGIGSESDPITAIPSTTPGAPVLGSATHGDIKVTLVWAEPLDTGGSPITDYEWTTDSGASWDTFGSTALTGEITPLVNGTPYTFEVRAVNANGVGLLSSNSLTSTPSTTPGAPVLNSATPGAGKVTLAWEEPLDTGDSPITDYEWTNNSGASWDTFGSTALTGEITPLANGTTYTFEVRAVNANGVGLLSSNSLTSTPSSTPGAPVLNSATHGDIKVTLVWAEPLDTGGSPITDYEWTDNSGASWDAFGSTALTGEITPLANGTPYTFEVRAVNANGVGLLSSNSLTATPSTTPGAPVLNSATHGDIKVTLVWAEPLDTGGSPITDYEWTDNSGASWDAFGSTALTGEITPLTNGTPYTFEVRAVNANGVGLLSSNSLTATPSTTPGAPVLNSATPGDGRVTLAWSPPLDTGDSPITSYQTMIGTSPWSGNATNLSVTWTGLTNGLSYTFRVRASNENGGGLGSNVLSATPTA